MGLEEELADLLTKEVYVDVLRTPKVSKAYVENAPHIFENMAINDETKEPYAKLFVADLMQKELDDDEKVKNHAKIFAVKEITTPLQKITRSFGKYFEKNPMMPTELLAVLDQNWKSEYVERLSEYANNYGVKQSLRIRPGIIRVLLPSKNKFIKYNPTAAEQFLAITPILSKYLGDDLLETQKETLKYVDTIESAVREEIANRIYYY